jgi:3-deoxy-manno-octulosonate cytidylyltransferase (CMP-KDO synthetase)
MKIIGVIPARYASSRFPGKPLADICGKPMIWWVYQQVKRVTEFDNVYTAIDNEKIAEVCKFYDIPFVMTRNDHPNHINRVHEVSEMVGADYYICVNGDEPLISPDTIRKIFPSQVILDTEYFGGAMRTLTDPAETIDCANIKLAVTKEGYCVYMSRTAVPYPQGTLMFRYKKYVGIECFNKKALDFFVNTEMGLLEEIEDIDHIRFLENGKKLFFTEIESESISVDTPKDLEKVREMLKGQP